MLWWEKVSLLLALPLSTFLPTMLKVETPSSSGTYTLYIFLHKNTLELERWVTRKTSSLMALNPYLFKFLNAEVHALFRGALCG